MDRPPNGLQFGLQVGGGLRLAVEGANDGGAVRQRGVGGGKLARCGLGAQMRGVVLCRLQPPKAEQRADDQHHRAGRPGQRAAAADPAEDALDHGAPAGGAVAFPACAAVRKSTAPTPM